MAKNTKPAEPEIDDEANYNVTLKGVALLGRLRLLPRDSHELSGAALKILRRDYADAVESYELKG